MLLKKDEKDISDTKYLSLLSFLSLLSLYIFFITAFMISVAALGAQVLTPAWTS